MDFSNYIFRSHMVGNIINVPKPLTQDQNATLANYRERNSGIGRLLTEKQKDVLKDLEYKEMKSRVYELSDFNKAELTKIVCYEKSGRSKILENAYLEKGLKVEKSARDLISKVLGILLTSDDERKSNKWVTGKRDIFSKSVIPDIKATYSYETFIKHLLESASSIYLRQLDSYMDLWKIYQSLLCFVLIDTPSNLVDKEIIKASYSKDILSLDGDIKETGIEEVKRIITNHIYTRSGLEKYCSESSYAYIEWFDDFVEIPDNERIHMIPHSYDKVRIEQRNECIILSREFMNTVKPINNIIQITA